MNGTLDSRALFPILVLLAAASILVHSSQYWPDFKSLFLVTAALRFAVAAGVGLGGLIVLAIVNRLMSGRIGGMRMLNACGLLMLLTAVAMVAASWGHAVPEYIFQLYS